VRDLPFQPTLVIDTREPQAGGWEPFFTVPTVRAKLDQGDFSVYGAHAGSEQIVAVERKADDLVSCLMGENRERFCREMARLQAVPYKWIIVETSWPKILSGRYFSRMNPKAAFESAVALMVRYNIPVLTADDAKTGALLCQSLLLRWVKEHWRSLEMARKASEAAVPHQINGLAALP
jgi:DNA excision repair protein ERCC-4